LSWAKAARATSNGWCGEDLGHEVKAMAGRQTAENGAARSRVGLRLLGRGSVRLRLTVLYGVLFVGSGVILLAISGGVLTARSSSQQASPAGGRAPSSALSQAEVQIRNLQGQIANMQAGSTQSMLSHR
jgi:hypothetical protein